MKQRPGPIASGAVRVPELPQWARDQVESYLSVLSDQRGLSENTILAYRRDLAQFFDYCARSGVDSIEGVERRLARRYLAFLDTLGYSRRSTARKASSVRSFYADALRRGSVKVNPFAGVSTPKTPRSLPHALPARTVIGAIEAIDTSDPIGIRDKALLETLYATGLRIA